MSIPLLGGVLGKFRKSVSDFGSGLGFFDGFSFFALCDIFENFTVFLKNCVTKRKVKILPIKIVCSARASMTLVPGYLKVGMWA